MIMKHTGPLAWLAGIVCAFCLMIAFLITSVEAVVYWTPGYFETEYETYQVPETVHMQMDDLLYVTEEMMAYLRGNRDDLHIDIVVDGQEREFFNEREIAHMEDVRELFIGALYLRAACLAAAALCIIFLILSKASLRFVLPRALCAGTGIFFMLTAVLAAVISTDFTKYFVIFHKIFFDNDLWILDPATDLLINIVPEPFFMDTAARIGVTFGLMVLFLFAVCLAFILFTKKRKPLTPAFTNRG